MRAGDDRAFELLFTRYQPRIAAYVHGMVRDHGRAEDITQEVFMSALRRMRATDREIVFKPWIYEIAKNACIDAYRRTRHTHEVSFDAQDAIGAAEHGRLAEPCTRPDTAIEGKLAFDNLRGAFGGLSQIHHDVLVMREFEGLSYQEIGERLGLSRPAVESTLFRARKRLTEEYEELVSGDRCRDVQRVVDASGGRARGLREQRKLARHLAHCQPCRRYARLMGADLAVAAGARVAATRIAAFVPLPAFLRRRWGGDDAGLLGQHGSSVASWSANVTGIVVDPGVVSGWTKAIATAATVAVAGIGTGAAMTERPVWLSSGGLPVVAGAPPVGMRDLDERGSSFAGAGDGVSASAADPAQARRSSRDADSSPAGGGAGATAGAPAQAGAPGAPAGPSAANATPGGSAGAGSGGGLTGITSGLAAVGAAAESVAARGGAVVRDGVVARSGADNALGDVLDGLAAADERRRARRSGGGAATDSGTAGATGADRARLLAALLAPLRGGGRAPAEPPAQTPAPAGASTAASDDAAREPTPTAPGGTVSSAVADLLTNTTAALTSLGSR